MKGLKKIVSKFDASQFKSYLVLSIIILIAIIFLGKVQFTEAKYETNTETTISPNFAFFIVDVFAQNQHLVLDNLTPRATPYEYRFEVSNFKGSKKANVDLTYSIELISTTNLPITIKLFKGTNTSSAINYTETITQNSDNVYFRHLLYSGVSTMNHDDEYTDIYTLWVEFPERLLVEPPSTYIDTSEKYAGVIELIDIEIRAEQVVSSS